MGSSTTYGYFPPASGIPRDSAWAFKIKKYYKDLGIIDTLYNIATNGINCYIGMPSSYIPPPGRDFPNSEFNITRAVNFSPKPDVIIVNFPSNGYVTYSISEIIYCLQTIKDSANINNIACYITTSQPRDDFNDFERQKLMDIKVAIQAAFGVYAIDFYSDIVNLTDLKRKPMYAADDLVHLNPAGHTVLKNQVIQKNIFFSPVAASFGLVNGRRQSEKVIISWEILQESDNDKFIIERSNNGVDFVIAGTVLSRGNSSQKEYYSYIDMQSGPGTVFYRIAAVNHAGLKLYSSIIIVKAESGSAAADLIYPTITNDKLTLVLGSGKKESVRLKINDTQGKTVMSKKTVINSNELFPVIVSQLPAGTYILSTEYNGRVQSHRFIKL